MAKRAQKIREDHLERQETAEELRERIRVLLKLKEKLKSDKTKVNRIDEILKKIDEGSSK